MYIETEVRIIPSTSVWQVFLSIEIEAHQSRFQKEGYDPKVLMIRSVPDLSLVVIPRDGRVGPFSIYIKTKF